MSFKRIGQTGLTEPGKSQPEAGRSVGKPTSGGSLAKPSEIAAWLSKQSPAAVDAKIRLRASSLNVGLLVTTKTIFQKDDDGNRLPMVDVASGCTVAGNAASIPEVIRIVEATLTPAPALSIEVWLVELNAITAGRRREGVDAAVAINAYSSRLREYPADVARAALLDERWKWFPTWAELAAICDRLAAPRKHMLAALQAPPPRHEPVRREATDEERAEIQRIIDKAFPAESQEWRDRAGKEAANGKCMAMDGQP